MKSSKKMFILVECILGCLLIGMIIFTVQKRQGQDLKRISVIIQNSDETQWSAFKYGLKMAAQDENVDVFIINPTQFQTAKEEMSAIQHEIDKGADALIIEPVADETLAEQLKKIKVPVLLLSELSAAPENTSKIPVAEPDHYEMGKRLVEELLKDNDGKLKQKKVGIFLSNNRSEAIKKREKGVQDALSETDAKICWVTEAGEDAKLLKQQEKVDYLFALDDRSLVEAGKAVKENEKIKQTNAPIIKISALKKEGIEKLEEEITKLFNLNEINLDNEIVITNARHKNLISKAIENVKKTKETMKNEMPLDIVAIFIKDILEDLANITGEIVTDDIIDEIFAKFCLGK